MDVNTDPCLNLDADLANRFQKIRPLVIDGCWQADILAYPMKCHNSYECLWCQRPAKTMIDIIRIFTHTLSKNVIQQSLNILYIKCFMMNILVTNIKTTIWFQKLSPAIFFRICMVLPAVVWSFVWNPRGHLYHTPLKIKHIKKTWFQFHQKIKIFVYSYSIFRRTGI